MGEGGKGPFCTGPGERVSQEAHWAQRALGSPDRGVQSQGVRDSGDSVRKGRCVVIFNASLHQEQTLSQL